MATRLFFSGFETREFENAQAVGAGLEISSNSPKTGSYSARVKLILYDPNVEYPVSSVSQFQVACHWKYRPAYYSNRMTPAFSWLESGPSRIGLVYAYGADPYLRLEIKGASVAAGSTPLSEYTYYHVGADVKISSSGWAYVYLDGDLEIAYDGNTCSTGPVTRIDLGAKADSDVAPKDNTYFDDFWADDTSGNISPSPPKDLRFLPLYPNGAGASSNFDVNGASVNYEAVDDWLSGSADGSTTYVSSSVNASVDLYDLEDPSTGQIAASDAIHALTLLIKAQESGATGSAQLELACKSGSSLSYGSAQSLGTSWNWKWQQFTTDPDTGAAWADASAIGDAQLGYRAAIS